jgi:hypothetical protein
MGALIETEEEAERRFKLTCGLVRDSAWGEIDHAAPYDPMRLLPEIKRQLRGLDGLTDSDAADRLAEGMRLLLQLVEECRYPRWAEGYGSADYYRDGCDDLVSGRNDEELLGCSPRWLYRYVREAFKAVEQPTAAVADDFDVVARNGYRRVVSGDKVSEVHETAGDLAIDMALIAVRLDPGVVGRALES